MAIDNPNEKKTGSGEKIDSADSGPRKGLDFIRTIISEDVKNGKNSGRVITRFPPEPNGYLHIGHAKAIVLNFGIAGEYPNARCHLRLDDTNPEKEEEEFVESIKKDVAWLGFQWGGHLYYASDYFEKLYQYAVQLIQKGQAYVESLSAEEVRSYRGTLTTPGKESPYRNRSVEENLELFSRMRRGEFDEGSLTLRAKIDMAAANLNMRDATIYRIRKAAHQRTGNQWCIYPMYDFAHGQSDSIEGVTHSLCTLEFEDHRPLYDWFLNELQVESHPQQIEFARLNISQTVLSKRKLLKLVQDGHVEGWSDPRMPTISGLRRRGYTPEAIRNFCESVGIAKSSSVVDIRQLEFFIREDLNKKAQRAMAVLNPLKVVIVNYPEGKEEELDAVNNQEDPDQGKRQIPFAKEIYIEKEDFQEDPPKKFFRLAPGKEVRLAHAYYITCVDVIKDQKTGEIMELHCTYDPQTRGGWSQDGRKVKGTLHWVSLKHAKNAVVRLYDHLFRSPNPEEEKEGDDLDMLLNQDSLKVLEHCKVEPSLVSAKPAQRFQFLRQGYFCLDSQASEKGELVFNRTVSLKDSWAKMDKDS